MLETSRSNASSQDRVSQLETALDNIPEAVLVVDQAGMILFANRIAGEILKNIPDSLEPDQWPAEFGLYLDDEQTHFPANQLPLKRALAGEADVTEEMLLLSGDDHKHIWITMMARPILDEAGQVSGAVVSFRDMTYRKLVEISREKHARRAEALYSLSRSLAEIGGDLSQIMNSVVSHAANFIGDACLASMVLPDGKTLQITAAYHPDAAIRSMLREHIVSNQFDSSNGFIGGVVVSGEPLLLPHISDMQLQMVSLPEFSRYIEQVGIQGLLVVPIMAANGILGTLELYRDRGGKPYTADDQSFMMDVARRTALSIELSLLIDSLRSEVAERQAAEQARVESDLRFQLIFETTSIGIKVLDLEGRILQVNPAFQDIAARPLADLQGKNFIDFVHPADMRHVRRHFNRLQDGSSHGLYLRHRLIRKDGTTVWVKTTFARVEPQNDASNPAFIVGMVENITGQIKLEAEMKEVKRRLQDNVEKERLHLAQELHDGPMQELYSAIYQLEALRSVMGTDVQERLDTIKNDIQGVVHSLRSTSQELRPPTIGDFGLEKAIRSHAGDFHEKYPDLRFYLVLARDQQMLSESVRLALYRIYQHSLANIVRHAEASEVRVRFNFDVEEARLEIQDNGRGFNVPENWIELTRQGHFGLAGAAERAEAVGGKFLVESRPGHGTLVRVTIPLDEGSHLDHSAESKIQ